MESWLFTIQKLFSAPIPENTISIYGNKFMTVKVGKASKHSIFTVCKTANLLFTRSRGKKF